ncbi:MAG: AmmeMemoRadiSam system radical SAM enzyme [Kiritimatiellaeota bacterium]|nr:AmmeMemoRadiSam system radical SAM enzyme [Kiritimatiellota bacterium]
MSPAKKQPIRCSICPKRCLIPPGFSGECRIRMNIGGVLRASTYGRPCAVHVDPMEKKPLFHFFPSAPILSIGTVGCNLRCTNCQNADISQANPEDVQAYDLPPSGIPALAARHTCSHVAYTYTEPLVSYEYTLDCAHAARAAGLRNVLITAGYINATPLRQLLPFIDAANVDIKAFSDPFYRDVCNARLAPVLQTVKTMKEAGTHIEITNLMVPTLNDSDDLIRQLCAWVAGNIGTETPLHFSRFFPKFKMTHLPPTPIETLTRARHLAREEGLKHVYIGNAEVADGETTFCATCTARLVTRERYVVRTNRLTTTGVCPDCGKRAQGVWS